MKNVELHRDMCHKSLVKNKELESSILQKEEQNMADVDKELSDIVSEIDRVVATKAGPILGVRVPALVTLWLAFVNKFCM